MNLQAWALSCPPGVEGLTRRILPAPMGSFVVPFWDYLLEFLNMKHKKELLRSLWVLL